MKRKIRVWYAKNKKKRVYKYREGAHMKIRRHGKRYIPYGEVGGRRA